MDGSYAAYQKVRLTGDLPSYVAQLQELGDCGWEVINVASPPAEVQLRRPPYDTPGPDSWEYTVFDIYDMPIPEWWDHISSCGWTIINPAYFQHLRVELHFAKRPGSWRGTDDGNIWLHLRDLGWAPSSKEPLTKVVREILKVKWEQSERQGHNIGTYSAVRYWLAHMFLPRVMKGLGLPMPDPSSEAALDELLNLRLALREGEIAPSLSETIRFWSKTVT